MTGVLIFKIAWRYLFSKKSTQAINIISGTAMSGMAIGVMALLLVLSVFNGFSGLVLSLYNQYSPDIKVSIQNGKVFTLEKSQWEALLKINNIQNISRTIEEKAMLKNGDNEYIATVKGIDENYVKVNSIKEALVKGELILFDHEDSYMVLGAGVASMLSINVNEAISPISVILPKRGSKSLGLLPSESFVRRYIYPSGILSVQTEFDYEYVYVPLSFLQEALRYDHEISGLEIKIKNEKLLQATIEEVETILGNNFIVKNKIQQDETLFKIMNTERVVAYGIFTFVLIIISFNITGALSMIALEKQKDVSVLKIMGFDQQQILLLFLGVGILIATLGGILGILAALLIGYLQIKFALLKMNTSTMVVDAYPIAFDIQSFIFVSILVMSIGFIAAFYPAFKASRATLNLKAK